MANSDWGKINKLLDTKKCPMMNIIIMGQGNDHTENATVLHNPKETGCKHSDASY